MFDMLGEAQKSEARKSWEAPRLSLISAISAELAVGPLSDTVDKVS